MKRNNRSNALLLELLIVVMFFMLASTTLVRLFGEARRLSARAEQIAQAITDSQNVADRLYAAAEPEALLNELGFREEGGLWVLDQEKEQLEVSLEVQEGSSGVMRRQTVTVRNGEGEVLFTLPADRFLEVSP